MVPQQPTLQQVTQSLQAASHQLDEARRRIYANPELALVMLADAASEQGRALAALHELQQHTSSDSQTT